MNKKLLIVVLVCIFVFLLGMLAKEPDTEHKQSDVKKHEVVKEWQTNPEAFAKLFFGDDLSVRSPRKKATFLRTAKKSIIDKVNGLHVEWPAKFGINPGWLSMPEERRKELSKISGNIAIYSLYRPDVTGWIWLMFGSRQEGTQEITWRQMTWGIPPQSDVRLKMKLKNVVPIIMKNGMLVIYVEGSELEIETLSKRCDWPEYSSKISRFGTRYEVQITSVHEFPVKVGLRSDDKGEDFIVPSKGEASIFVPKGKYDIYFQYAADPTSLYQGESLDIVGAGFEIQLDNKEAGSYEIRKIK